MRFRRLFGLLGPSRPVDLASIQSFVAVDTEPLPTSGRSAFPLPLRALAEKLHSGRDELFNKSMQPLKMLPTWIIRPLVHTFGYLSGVWGLNIPALGLEPHPFGARVITNVGVFGLDEGFAPPTPFAHAPVLVLVGAIRDTPVVRDGEVVVRAQMTLCATIDHRYIDGAQGGVLAKVVRDVLENPWQLEGMDGPPA